MDAAFNTLAECLAWGEPKFDLVVAIGVGFFSLGKMIAALLRSESAWNSDVSFCDQVMLAKEMKERDREKYKIILVRQALERVRYCRRVGRRRSQNDIRLP